VCFSFLFLGY